MMQPMQPIQRGHQCDRQTGRLAAPWQTLRVGTRRAVAGLLFGMAMAGAAAGAGMGPGTAHASDEAPDVAGQRVPVAPLDARINAAAFGPMPAGASFVIRRYDDSREHDAVERALSGSLAARGTERGGTTPLDMTFDVYVIRSGVPEMAMSVLDIEDARGPSGGTMSNAPRPGIDVTSLHGRAAGVEGNVLHGRQDSFAAIMRLQVTVSDPTDGDFLWRGWVDTPLNGLSRAQVAHLVADPLLSTLGRTVANHTVTVAVPQGMGGARSAPDMAE